MCCICCDYFQRAVWCDDLRISTRWLAPPATQKAALVVAGVALVVVGAKAINDRNNSTEHQAKNSVDKVFTSS